MFELLQQLYSEAIQAERHGRRPGIQLLAKFTMSEFVG